MYVKRRKDKDIEAFIKRPDGNKNVLLVEGARQVGKTELVKHAVDNCGKRNVCVNLEEDTLLCSLIDDCASFDAFTRLLRDRLDFHPDTDMVLFIDEAQESMGLGRHVRFMKEKWEWSTVILSGSTLRRLFRPGVRYPVGRVTRLVLGPFSFSEYLTAFGKTHLAADVLNPELELDSHQHQLLLDLFDGFLRRGGLPAVVLSHGSEEADAVRAQIVADYERDFIRLFGEELLPIVKACFRSVASFVGSPSKNSSVVSSPSSSMNEKVNAVFSRLENWHLFILSEQKGPGPEGSHGYLPKRYMFDTGVLRHFREAALPPIGLVNKLTAVGRAPLGGIIENQVAIEINRLEIPVYGWKKSSSGAEIDFVLSGAGHTPVECKAALSVNLKHMRGVREYLRMYSLKSGVIVSLAPLSRFTFSDDTEILNLPVYLAERLASDFVRNSAS